MTTASIRTALTAISASKEAVGIAQAAIDRSSIESTGLLDFVITAEVHTNSINQHSASNPKNSSWSSWRTRVAFPPYDARASHRALSKLIRKARFESP